MRLAMGGCVEKRFAHPPSLSFNARPRGSAMHSARPPA